MAPLTWQTVATPDFRGTMAGLAISNEALNRGFTGLSDALGKFDTYRKDAALSDLLATTTAIQNPADIRTAVAGMDLSRLGPAQFAAFNTDVQGRIAQAKGLEDVRHATANNPTIEAQSVENLNDSRLRHPLERTQIVANTNNINASAGLTAARTKGVLQENEFNAQTAPSRLAAAITGNENITQNNRFALIDAPRQRAANLQFSEALDVAGNDPQQFETEVYRRLQNKQIDEDGAARMMQLFRDHRVKYGTGEAPTGAPAGGRGQAAATAAPAAAPAPMVPIPGQEDFVQGSQARSSAVNLIAKATEAEDGKNQLETNANAYKAALTNFASFEDVAAQLRKPNTAMGSVDPKVVDIMLKDIVKRADEQGVKLTPTAAGLMLSSGIGFDTNTILQEYSGRTGIGAAFFSGDPSKNSPALNYKAVDAAIAQLKPAKGGDVSPVAAAAAASEKITATLDRIKTAEAQAAAADRAYYEQLRRAEINPKAAAPLPELKKKAEVAAARVNTMMGSFLENNPQVRGRINATSGRPAIGLPMATQDTPVVVPAPVAVRPPAPPAVVVPDSIPPGAERYRSSFGSRLWDRFVR